MGIGTNSKMMIGHDLTTTIGQTKVDAMIIGGMIGMMITYEMMIVEMTNAEIIVTSMIVIIRKGMIKGHTKVIEIEGGMMIIDMIIIDSMMTDGMIIDDPKDRDSFNIILRVEIMQNPKMFGRTHYEKGEANGLKVPNRYPCVQDCHHANQYLTKDKGKTSAFNMVIVEVQQVTTRSMAKQSEWDIQEEIRKAVNEWVEEANNNNVARMLQESTGPIVTFDNFDSQ